ncbi:MAG: S-layer homology domain-containing protein, partial [Clostridia bacterium]
VADTTFNITREEAATILYRIKAGASDSNSATFIDNDKISQYAEEAIANFAFNKIINGYEDGSFKPISNIKRGEAAKIIAEWINKILR